MAATGFELDINLTDRPRRRERGLLLDASPPIPNEAFTRPEYAERWKAGVEWLPWGTGNISTDPSDCVVVYDMAARELPDLVTQNAFLLWDALKCSTLNSTPEMLAMRAEANLDVFASAAFAVELETAAQSGGIGLVGDATYVPSVASPFAVSFATGIAALEDHLATVLHGAAGMIHLPASLLALHGSDGLFEYRDGAYRTATGHVVVGDAGHVGSSAPQGQSAAGASEKWIYASGPVYHRIGMMPPNDSRTVDGDSEVYIARNENRPVRMRHGLVAFDPNTLGAALVGVADSTAAATYTAPAVGAVAGVSTIHGWSVYNSHASDAVLVYIRHGDQATDTPFTPLAVAAGQSVNFFLGSERGDGIPVSGTDGIYITDESTGAATVADLVGHIIVS